MPHFVLQQAMLDEFYSLEYKCEVLEDMCDSKRIIFDGPLRKFVISAVQVKDVRVIRFNFYQDHFLEVVTKWAWLLCSNLGAHLEEDTGEISYNSVVNPRGHKRRNPTWGQP